MHPVAATAGRRWRRGGLGLALAIFEPVAKLLHLGLELCDPTTKLLQPRATLTAASRVTPPTRLAALAPRSADAFALAQFASTTLGLGALVFLRHVHLNLCDDPTYPRILIVVDGETLPVLAVFDADAVVLEPGGDDVWL